MTEPTPDKQPETAIDLAEATARMTGWTLEGLKLIMEAEEEKAGEANE